MAVLAVCPASASLLECRVLDGLLSIHHSFVQSFNQSIKMCVSNLGIRPPMCSIVIVYMRGIEGEWALAW